MLQLTLAGQQEGINGSAPTVVQGQTFLLNPGAIAALIPQAGDHTIVLVLSGTQLLVWESIDHIIRKATQPGPRLVVPGFN